MQPFGDLAQGIVLRHRIGDIKSRMQTLSSELTTGLTTDVAAHVGGDLSAVADLERRLSVLEAFRVTNAEATTITAAMQDGMDLIQNASQTVSGQLLQVDLLQSDSMLETMSKAALSALRTTVSVLNQSTGSRSIFAGTATDGIALEDVDTLLSLVRTEVAGQTTASDVLAALDNWFDTPGGGFETAYYRGSANYQANLQLSETESAGLRVKADDPVFRETLKTLAMAALVTDPSLGLNRVVTVSLMKSTGESLLGLQSDLTDTRADLGVLQEKIDSVTAGNAAQKSSAQMALTNLIGIDPYESATRLEEVQFQLESLYTVTARTAGLNLAAYLR